MPTKTRVINFNGDKLYDAHPAQVARMLALNQAKYTADHRCLRVTGFTPEKEHPCRTHTSRGGMLAAIGRSQQYTFSTRGHVTGFKKIFAEDLTIFHAAVRDCLKTIKIPRLFLSHAHGDPIGDVFMEAKSS